jgi:hypothetical protein
VRAAPCSALASPEARFPHSLSGDCTKYSARNGSSCKPACSGSYPVTGDPFLYCFDGMWTPSPRNPFTCTSCVSMLSVNLPRPGHWAVGFCDRVVKNGHQCRPGCASGYGLRGPDAVTCKDAEFQWPAPSGLQCLLSCSPGNFPSPANGGLGSCAFGGLEGDYCNYNCSKGYVLVGEARKCRGNVWSLAENAVAQVCTGAVFVHADRLSAALFSRWLPISVVKPSTGSRHIGNLWPTGNQGLKLLVPMRFRFCAARSKLFVPFQHLEVVW